MNYQKSIKNLSIVYDYKYGKFNYLSYDCNTDKNYRNHTIIEDLNREKKLKTKYARRNETPRGKGRSPLTRLANRPFLIRAAVVAFYAALPYLVSF